ncbi:MAG TPA: FkbM family methyltransferase [Hyphomicrobium sp.]|nr:FkbM family methyltransferase [Hyphomicrobium sp.]
MQISRTTLPLLKMMRMGGLNNTIRGLDRVIRGLFPIASQTAGTIEVPYQGMTYAASPRHYVDWQVLTVGSYEPADLAVFRALHTHLSKVNVLDIGANVGHHAFFFASLGWRVWAFEPNPELWPIFETKIKTANIGSVHLARFGLGDKDEFLVFQIPDSDNSGTGQFVPNVENALLDATTLPVRRGDEFVREAGIGQVDVIKMDVQGFEPQALLGLRQTLETSRPIVSVEIGPENRSSISTLEALGALLPSDYAYARVRQRNLGPLRLPRLEELTSSAFLEFEGNLFCSPSEKMTWMLPTR